VDKEDWVAKGTTTNACVSNKRGARRANPVYYRAVRAQRQARDNFYDRACIAAHHLPRRCPALVWSGLVVCPPTPPHRTCRPQISRPDSLQPLPSQPRCPTPPSSLRDSAHSPINAILISSESGAKKMLPCCPTTSIVRPTNEKYSYSCSKRRGERVSAARKANPFALRAVAPNTEKNYRKQIVNSAKSHFAAPLLSEQNFTS
jgi:hypothetical protein